MRITKVKASTVGISTPTLTFNLEERSYGSVNSAGVEILSSDLVADADGQETTDFANPSQEYIEINDYIVFTTNTSAESGETHSVTVTVFYELLN